MPRGKKEKVTLADFRAFDARAAKGRAVADAVDAKLPIPHAVTIRAHRFAAFLNVLTPKRYELLHLAKAGQRSISELAIAAKRDPSSVSKDVAKLVDLGLHM